MNYKMVLYNARMVLRDLAEYLREENIDIKTARQVMECQANIALPSHKIAYIAGQCGIAGGLIEAVYNVQRLLVEYEAIDWLEYCYTNAKDIEIITQPDGRVVFGSGSIEL